MLKSSSGPTIRLEKGVLSGNLLECKDIKKIYREYRGCRGAFFDFFPVGVREIVGKSLV